jgi:hypothetical protein
MSDSIKVAGIITSGFCCAILAVVYAIEPSEFIKALVISFGGVFGIFFPLPALYGVAKKLLNKV